ncbi:serpin B5-like [Spodoptera litura]|uniref:Serpin B5-like n=1 Tax=Spodoptera litura TaxID=69820 RepID=A0A9J7ESR0_SPOLT|nr:serpin B5-like [Spodoptera litura]
MIAIILGFCILTCSASKRDVVSLYGSLDTLRTDLGACSNYPDVVDGYRDAMYNFTIETYKRVAPRGTYQFVVSPHSLWMTVAAIAEGANHETQQQLFQLLLLPNDACVRQKYYQLAASRFSYSSDATVVSNRALVIDHGVTPNPAWHNFVTKNSLIEVVSAPIRHNPVAAASSIRQAVYANYVPLNLQGNSVLIDTMDYNGLWNTAFADAVVQRAPFHSISGQRIGTVDMMTVKRRCKIGYVPSISAKILELPIGTNSQYSMVIALVVGNSDVRPVIREFKSSIVTDVLTSLRDSYVPIDIALPQFTLNSEVDVKVILEDLGITSLWTDPDATRYISTPPALPSSYVQRATLTLNKHGVNPPLVPGLRSSGYPKTPEESFWNEFIADRPFMFGLFDTETYTCLMSNMYSQPTYPDFI